MREWLIIVSEAAITLIDALALFVILVGTIEVAFKVARASFKPLGDRLARQAWLRYARWLVAGLTPHLPQLLPRARCRAAAARVRAAGAGSAACAGERGGSRSSDVI